MSERSAKILLASVILARSSSYVLQKIGLTDIDVFNLMGIRFLMAFVIMLIIFNKKLLHADKASVLAGVIVGAAYFIVMSFEVFSLKTCESSTTAFLENTAIVMVPLFEAFLLRKMPLPKTILGFIMAMTGVSLMTLQNADFHLTTGHALAIGAAITYAAAIIITDRVSKKADALVIGVVQLGTMGGLSAVSSFIFETPHFPSEPVAWLAIILLALVCSCFGFTLQPVAQKHTSAETAGLYCAFGPLGAGILGWICLGEALSLFAFAGAILILLSILIVQRKPAE
ncbi:MAG: DMT family transporter [Peptococcaceae bacterium]|nr:DMT family transporter [Peptococcaceae bacterium]